MKILIMANGYPTDKEPQWGCFEKDQALALQRLGHDVCIMYIDGRFRMEKRKIGVNHFYDKGLSVYGIFWFPFVLISKLKINLKLKLKQRMLCSLYKKMVKMEGKPDIIYAHYLYNIACASILKKKFNIPLVGIEHWSVLNQDVLAKDILYGGDIAYNNADKIISVSETLKMQIYKHFHHDSIVIHNMVGEEFFIQRPIQERNSDEIVFVSTGSLIKRKGYDILIKALAIISSKLGLWKLNIIGDGPERDNLQQMIDAYHLNNNVKLLGRKNKQEIISLLHDSDMFVFPSRMENFSVAVLEALSTGLPVVATICGGIKECIDEKNGILVPVEDVDSLATGILAMYKNLKNYDCQAIADDCKKQFSPNVIVQQLISVFEEVKQKNNL